MGGNFVEGGNNTNSAIDSFTHKEGEEPGPSDELKRNPAVSSKPLGSLFWVCCIIFVVMHSSHVAYLVRCVILLSKLFVLCVTFSP